MPSPARLLLLSIALIACHGGDPQTPPPPSPPPPAPAAPVSSQPPAQVFAPDAPDAVFLDPDRRRKLASAFPEIDAIVTEAVTRAKLPGAAVGVACARCRYAERIPLDRNWIESLAWMCSMEAMNVCGRTLLLWCALLAGCTSGGGHPEGPRHPLGPGETASSHKVAAEGRAAAKNRPLGPDETDGSDRCDNIQLSVTDRDYVWIEDRREEVVSIDVAVDRLAACQAVLAKPKICRPELNGACAGRTTPIWWDAPTVDEKARAQRHARVEALWAAVKQRGLTILEPNYTSDRDDAPIYRSRGQLGASADLVPSGFDFSRFWLARAMFPNGKWTTSCLDERLGKPPEMAREDERQQQAKREHLLHGRAARLADARLDYGVGKLYIHIPRATGMPTTVNGPCQWNPEVEAVLVPVPHSSVPIATKHPNQQ